MQKNRRRNILSPAAKVQALRRACWSGLLRALLLPFHHPKCHDLGKKTAENQFSIFSTENTRFPAPVLRIALSVRN